MEKIDRHWTQHIDDYDTRNKHYREDNNGGYTINMRAFDISGALGRPRLMENGNESLLTMVMQKNFGDTNTIEGSTLVTDQTEVSTFTADSPHENEKLKDMLAKHQDTIPHEVLEYLTKIIIPPQGERG